MFVIDNFTGKCPRNISLQDVKLTGRQPCKKTISKEDNTNRKKTLQGDSKRKAVGSVARVSQSGSELGPAQPGLFSLFFIYRL